ncbi:inositol monophosphatase [Syntrophotalea acetylenivorans]|uniref:Inositol-1-monophosphatase n=1 Tax=Syntrophotalea acetylenivorans TaxID=1842532 RepID=A0A1L3GSC7_9BACT|nr:inositol monophosphatase family protein [Syntrophotalea acetylenivorans]APG28770.1 inositol monophosphatase [Syntrophotalea acetylenivorans]
MKELLETASILAEKAGEHIRQSASQLRQVDYKGRADMVTDVDRRAEKIILEGIRQAYPDHAVLAEESGEKEAQSDYRWVVDPLDGTTNFVHGYPFYCVSIAVQYRQETVAALVLNPVLDELFSALKGDGAHLNGKPIEVSPTCELSRALVATGFPYEFGEHWEHSMTLFETFYRNCHGVRRDGAAALDLCYVAAGRFDGFWEYELQPWDVAAGLLIVQEAGGKTTDFKDNPSGICDGQVLASNGRIHDEMLRVIGSHVV